MDHASSTLLDPPDPVEETPRRRRRHAYERADDERINKVASIPFWLIHALALLGIVLFGFSTKTVVLCVGVVLRAHVVHHGGVPPVLRASVVQDESVVPVRAGLRRCNRRAEGSVVVGRSSPQPPSRLRHRSRHPLTATRFLVEPSSAGSSVTSTTRSPSTASRTSHRYPELRFVDKYNGFAPWIVGLASFLVRRLGRSHGRVLPLDGAAVAQHVLRELGRARVRPTSLRDRGHQPQQSAHRPHDDGRGLAQQPPLLPGIGAAGVLLVGDRPHLLRPEDAQLGQRSSAISRCRARRSSTATGSRRAPSTSGCSRRTGRERPQRSPTPNRRSVIGCASVGRTQVKCSRIGAKRSPSPCRRRSRRSRPSCTSRSSPPRSWPS